MDEELLRQFVDKNISDTDFKLFVMMCKKTALDPFSRQIFAVTRYDTKSNSYRTTTQTSIDGFRLIAERTGNYSPGRETEYRYDENKNLVSATSYVMKLSKDGTWHEVASIAFFDEYVQRGKGGEVLQFWKKMPHLMLAKCAESLALRKAFPAELSGIYTEDEMSQALPDIPSPDKEENLTPQDVEKIEDLLIEEGEEYRKDLLKFFTDKLKLNAPMKNFCSLPKNNLPGLLNAILKRKEMRAKKEESEEVPF